MFLVISPTGIAMEPLKDDRELSKLIDRYGELTVEPAEDPFQRLVTSIINQQLSTQSAAAIRKRVFNRFTITPDGLLDADEEAMADCGLSKQKIEYIKKTARKFKEDELSSEKFAEMPDEEVVEELTSIKGVGRWTAEMFLMFGLGREDVFSVGDLGLRRAMEQLYGDMTRSEMKKKAESWAPYRTYASLYLWKLHD
jgi:DNA-3-methyladenine glycosylase II